MKKQLTDTKQDLIERLKGVARDLGTTRLTERSFCAAAGVSRWAISRHFDSWSEACNAARLEPGLSIAQLPQEPEYTETECVHEVKRVAQLLKAGALSGKQYSKFGSISAKTLSRRFGSWENVLRAAGLGRTPRAERLRPHHRGI